MEHNDTLIIDRLGEHKRKIDFIQKYTKKRQFPHLVIRKPGFAILTAVACIAILVMTFAPFFFKSNNLSDISLAEPSFSEYRGGSYTFIEELIHSKQYSHAIMVVDDELVKIDEDIYEAKNTEMDKEEQEYILSFYNSTKEELMWSKIYLLVKLNDKKELKILCNTYLKENQFKEHINDVTLILEKIQ